MTGSTKSSTPLVKVKEARVKDAFSAVRRVITLESALTRKVRVKEEGSTEVNPSAKASGRLKVTGKEKARVKRHRISLASLAVPIISRGIVRRAEAKERESLSSPAKVTQLRRRERVKVSTRSRTSTSPHGPKHPIFASY